MKNSKHITSVESKVKLPEATVESYINHRYQKTRTDRDASGAYDFSSDHFEQIDICSAYSPVYGTLEIVCNTGYSIYSMNVPVSTRFLIICTRELESAYKLTWSFSLS
ncbi:hypothetical protein V9K67_07250 [Paraflavisolibacter sp. H34]|uniref:hypothetical protein n=1 Tax=Huijunlia imazamoxiresistens TaxID=3127457 RepID=UPI003019E29F